MYVCSFISAASHIGITNERYQGDHSNTGIVFNFADFSKKLWHDMPTSSRSGILALFPHEISFYASLKPIATFSMHKQGACGRQCTIH